MFIDLGRFRPLGIALTLALAACATTPPDRPCADLSGVYVNASAALNPSLAEVLLQEEQPTRTVAVASTANGTALTVRAGSTRRTLQSGVDYQCTERGIALNPVLTTDVDLPPLGSAQELTQYALEKRLDGSLVAHRTARRSATAFGIPFRGDAMEEENLVWDAAD